MKRRLRNCVSLSVLLAVLLAGCGRGKSVDPEEKAPVDKKAEALEIEIEEPVSEDISGQPEETGMTEPVVLEDLNIQIIDKTAYEQGKGTLISVYAEELGTGSTASVGSQPLQSASLIKLFIAGCIYEQPDVLKAQEQYENETEELIRQMITVSDNDATNTLVTRLGYGDAAQGMEAVNAYCGRHGFEDTHMGRLMLAPNTVDDNYTSVSDCGRFLAAVYRNELTGSEAILNYMMQQERTGKIPAGVPMGVQTANKTGELDTVENDVAIIYGDAGAYTLCIMLNQLPDAAAGRALITELSAMVYTYMESGM